ncbi:hypothetical protein TrVE_jg9811 [Triparma verrucosa]|uniref:Uncharacterized protein n=1 Tax=Triparma verrucosa TaxID=1606542 RepID=A0A9W7C2K9_9STRA|nr:hypothetical protein TrVE_jg9811 [Triparma verrucosa]
MGNWCSCSYKSGWNKGNACPPGFRTKEDCGCFSDTITCEFTGSVDTNRAISVGARYTVRGACTSDPTNPGDGGTQPGPAPSCSEGNADLVASWNTKCCRTSFGGACDVYGWAVINECSERPGDLVFDVRSPDGCRQKALGLSNNFAPMEWCKNAKNGMGAGTCWLPYSMQSDQKCFPYDKDVGQWVPGSNQWEGTTRKGGDEIVLDGLEWVEPEGGWVDGGKALVKPTIHTGSIAVSGGVGLACLVGVGALARRRAKRTLKQPEGNLELSGAAAGSV